MPIYIVPKRCHTDTLGVSSPKYCPESAIPTSNRFVPQATPQTTEKERALPQSLNKTEGINRTYVISACKKLGDSSVTSTSEGKKLSLQRRTVSNKGHLDQNTTHNSETAQTQRQPTLQRRLRTGSNEQCKTDDTHAGKTEKEGPLAQKSNETLFPPKFNCKDAPLVKNGLQSLKGHTDTKKSLEQKNNFLFNPNGSNGTGKHTPLKQRAVGSSQNEVFSSVLSAAVKPENRTSKAAEKVNSSNETGSEQNRSMKNESLERPKTPRKVIAKGTKFTTKCGPLPDTRTPAVSTIRSKTTCFQSVSEKKSKFESSISNPLTLSNKNRRGRENSTDTRTALLKEVPIQDTCAKDDPFRIENSKVIVAVRVRPFSTRSVILYHALSEISDCLSEMR